MNLRQILGIVFILLCLTNTLPAADNPSPASRPGTAVSQPSEEEKMVADIQEAQLKKLTLNYLADPRSKALLTDLLQGFSAQLKKNFRANINGAYRKVLLGNFDARISELNKDLALLAGDQKKENAFECVLSQIEKVQSPFTPAFAGVSKKLQDRISFDLAQRLTESGPSDDKSAFVDRISNLQARIEADSGKDPYDQVKALYANTSRTEFPIWWFDDAQYTDIGYTTHGDSPAAPEKKGRKNWTVLVFLNADNNLESAGLKDLNEMEMVGSDGKMNVIVQIDRMTKGEGNTIEESNWTGTRRYEVVREKTRKIGSKLVMNLGERNMGSRKELAEFLNWGIETYPADHYWVVVWNHGAGWLGISSDDTDDSMLSVPDVLWAFQQAKPSLEKINPQHPKFDVVDFDACLMGMLEIGYELRDTVDFLVASEETEPGRGMPYQDTLKILKETPGISPKELAKGMAGAYVKSYSIGGSQTDKRIQGDSVTKAAYDLSRIQPLAEAVDRLAQALIAQHDTYSSLLVDAYSTFGKLRRYDSAVDLQHFCLSLALLKELPEEVRAACIDILKLISYPDLKDRLSDPVVIKRKAPGIVIWGYNGWKMPPKEIRPARSQIYHSRFLATPLKGPDDNGDYVCQIGPFLTVIDTLGKKKEFVTEINYRVELADGTKGPEMVEKTGREFTFVTEFGPESPIIAEGHTQGKGNSYGISIYYPDFMKFRTSYKTLQFSKATSWDEFLVKPPRYQPQSKVLLAGGMVEDPSTLLAFIGALRDLGIKPDVLWDPKVFGSNFREVFAYYRNGAVITDSISDKSLDGVSPSSEDLTDYLGGGGALLLAAQSVEQNAVNLPFLDSFFHFGYVEDDRELPHLTFSDFGGGARKIELNGPDSAMSAKDVTIMECGQPSQLLVKTEDGRGAGISVAADSPDGKPYRGVYLGFRYEAVDTGEIRAALLGKILSVLLPDFKPPAPKPEPAE